MYNGNLNITAVLYHCRTVFLCCFQQLAFFLCNILLRYHRMKILKKTAAFGILLFGMHFASAQAGTNSQSTGTITVNGVGQTKTYSSDGGTAVISGVKNIITINGYVSRLEVSGSGNTIYTDKISRISVEGTDNKIFYTTAPNKNGKPSVSSSGVGNSVRKK